MLDITLVIEFDLADVICGLWAVVPRIRPLVHLVLDAGDVEAKGRHAPEGTWRILEGVIVNGEDQSAVYGVAYVGDVEGNFSVYL
jgi:hypothetical protein